MADIWWEKLAQAESRLVDALEERGVIRVEPVVSFGDPPRSVSLWLVTSTDVERDALGIDNPCLEAARAAVAQAGLKSEDVSELRTAAQSEETVARDFEGSWFYALR